MSLLDTRFGVAAPIETQWLTVPGDVTRYPF